MRIDMAAAAVFALALCARTLHILWMSDSPFFDHLLVDSVDFDTRATAFARGTWPEQGAFYQAPLYPLFLSAIYRIFGHDLLAVRLVQAVLGSASAILVYLIGRRCSGRAAAFAAGCMYALYSMSVHFDTEILRPSLAVFLSLASLTLLLEAAEKGGRRRWGASGLLLGLAAVARPTVLVFAPAALLWAILMLRRARTPGRGTRKPGTADGEGRSKRGRAESKRHFTGTGRLGAYGAAGLFLACALAPVASVTYMNYVRSGSFVPISYNGGINFYLGNNGDYDRTVGIRPGIRWDLLTAEPEADRTTDPAGWSRYYYDKAWDYISSNTGDYLGLLFKKLALFWNGHEIERNVSFAHVAEESPLMAYPLVSFRWVAPFALAGMALAIRRRAALGLPALFLFSQVIATVAFFVCARYRMTSVPVLCIFAGYAAVSLAAMVSRRKASAAAYLSVAALGAVAVNVDAYGIADIKYSRPEFELAMILRREGATEEALTMFERAARNNPGDPDPLFQWGVLLAGRGAFAQAAPLFEQAARAEPLYAKSWYNLGLCVSRSGEPDRAADAYRKALEADPYYWEAAMGLGDVLVDEGKVGEAAAVYTRALELGRNRKEIAVSSMSLGRARALGGEYEESLDHFDRALSISPGSVDARLAKARVLVVLGRLEEALAEARSAAMSDSSDARVKSLLDQLKEAGAGTAGSGR